MNATKTRPFRIEICIDCVALLANGEVVDEEGNDIVDELQDHIGELWGDTEITLGWDENDPEPWFSWSSCDCCGSTLGGNRQYAAVWLPTKEYR
jgi:hypothetical protein